MITTMCYIAGLLNGTWAKRIIMLWVWLIDMANKAIIVAVVAGANQFLIKPSQYCAVLDSLVAGTAS